MKRTGRVTSHLRKMCAAVATRDKVRHALRSRDILNNTVRTTRERYLRNLVPMMFVRPGCSIYHPWYIFHRSVYRACERREGRFIRVPRCQSDFRSAVLKRDISSRRFPRQTATGERNDRFIGYDRPTSVRRNGQLTVNVTRRQYGRIRWTEGDTVALKADEERRLLWSWTKSEPQF